MSCVGIGKSSVSSPFRTLSFFVFVATKNACFFPSKVSAATLVFFFLRKSAEIVFTARKNPVLQISPYMQWLSMRGHMMQICADLWNCILSRILLSLDGFVLVYPRFYDCRNWVTERCDAFINNRTPPSVPLISYNNHIQQPMLDLFIEKCHIAYLSIFSCATFKVERSLLLYQEGGVLLSSCYY